MAAPVFHFSDYKQLIRTRISEASQEWGVITQLAEAAKCQRSYLSRVLNTHVHLTLDHAFGLCEYWDFSEAEMEYFLALVEKERTASKNYRARLEAKLKGLKTDFEKLSSRVDRPQVTLEAIGEREHLYYSAWYWTAIHILTSVPEFQELKAVSKKLQLTEELALSVLKTLADFGFVKKEGVKWIYASGGKHIPKDSPLASIHHSNWRQRAIQDAQIPRSEGIHFTVVQSMSREAHRELKQMLLGYIDQIAKIAGPSREEELVGITLDIFST